MIKLLDIFFATRPMLQFAIWSVYLVSLHFHHLSTGETFGLYNLLVMVLISSLFSGAVYLNQLYDYQSDLENNKLGFLQKNFLTRRTLANGFIFFSIIPLIIIVFFSLPIFWIFAQLIVFGYIYSAPPLRLKDRPLSGLLTNSWVHGVLVSLTAIVAFDMYEMSQVNWGSPLYFFLTVAATHILTTIPDRKGDESTGKKTIAVALSRAVSLLIALVLVLISVIVAYHNNHAPLVYISLFASIMIMGCLFINSESLILASAKIPLLLLTLLAANYYPFYFLFVVALLFTTRIYYLKRFGIIYPKLA